MSLVENTHEDSMPVIELSVSDQMIEQYREEFRGLTADTKDGYEAVRKAIAVCRTTRTGIEKKRKELNEDARVWINSVNSEAKRLTAAVEEIEDPLKAKKQTADEEKERIKRQAEEARLRKTNDRIVRFLNEAGRTCSVIEAEGWADEEFEMALEAASAEYRRRLEDERQQEEERQKMEMQRAEELRKQQEEIDRQREELERVRAEQEKVRVAYEAEMARMRMEMEEKERVDRERMESERAAIEEEKRKLWLHEVERQAKLRDQEQAVRREEEERLAAERAKQEAIELQARLDALKPDLEKVQAYRDAISNAIVCVAFPELSNRGLHVALQAFRNHLLGVCEDFSGLNAGVQDAKHTMDDQT